MRRLVAQIAIQTFAASVCASTWTVDDDGPADFDSIQAAVDAASSGDVIIVEPGTYTGVVESEFEGPCVVVIADKSIELRSSQGAETTIIDAEHQGRAIYCHTSSSPGETVIDGFTIRNGYANVGGGVLCGSGDLTIVRCEIESNEGWGGGGGIFAGWAPGWGADSFVNILSCEIMGNTAHDGGGGGIRSYGGNVFISNTTVHGNSADFGGGIDCSISNSGATTQVTSSSFVGNTAYYDGGGVSVYDGASATFTDCIVCGNEPWQISEVTSGSWSNGGGSCVSEYCDDLNGDGEPDACACTGDCDLDGSVDIEDIDLMLIYWGTEEMSADVNDDGSVNILDLLLLLANWGSCP